MPYVRFERPPAISSADRPRPSAPATWSVKNPRNDSRSTPSGPPVATPRSLCGAPCGAASGDAGGAGLYGAAGALRVTRHAAHGHVDTEAGGGALLLGLATPEAVLAVLTCPVATLPHYGTRRADGTGLALALDAGLGSLTGGGEEQHAAPPARRVGRPCQGPTEDQVGDALHGRQGQPPPSALEGDSGEPVGGYRPPESS